MQDDELREKYVLLQKRAADVLLSTKLVESKQLQTETDMFEIYNSVLQGKIQARVLSVNLKELISRCRNPIGKGPSPNYRLV